MDADFTQMLADKHFFDLRRLQYKYGADRINDLLHFLYHDENQIAVPLPLSDDQGSPLMYIPGLVRSTQNSAADSEPLPYSPAVREEEIFSTLAIEGITVPRDSILRILNGKAPADETEALIHGMKQGLDFISDKDSTITAKNLRRLYQMTIGDFLNESDSLLPNHLYRHDFVFITGNRIEHRGLACSMLEESMNRLLCFISGSDQMDISDKAAVIHFYLAWLHPYFDGNGRISRLVHLWYMIQHGRTAALNGALSGHILRSKSAYYKAFSLIETNARISGVLDATPFLCYCRNFLY